MTMLAKLLTAALMCSSAALTGCGNDRVRLAPAPAELTVCADEPVAPDLPAQDWSSIEAAKAVQAVRDSAAFAYILAMRAAWGDCRADVAGVKAWNDRVGK